jgi:hypothetical protein
MRFFSFLLLLSLIFISCNNNLLVEYSCKDCDQKLDTLITVKKTPGSIVFSKEYNRYIVQIGSYSGPVFFVPCQIPKYFQPTEKAAVIFSGTLTEDPFVVTASLRTTYYCIKLDTIYSVAKK